MIFAPARSATTIASIVSAASLPSPHPAPESTTPMRLPIAHRLPRRRRERPAGDQLPCPAPEAQVVLEVVDRGQPIVEELLGVKEMRQVRPAIARAAGAGAPGLDRLVLVAVAGVADVQPPRLGEELAVARVARRHHAVEHVDAGADRLPDVLGGP